jgi:hypothetical protein
MDEQTFNAIVEFELQEDMRRAEERAVFLGHFERNSDGTLTLTDKGETYVLELVFSQRTLH